MDEMANVTSAVTAGPLSARAQRGELLDANCPSREVLETLVDWIEATLPEILRFRERNGRDDGPAVTER